MSIMTMPFTVSNNNAPESSEYGDDFEEITLDSAYLFDECVELCDKKKEVLLEYYKKRDAWCCADDNSIEEYNFAISIFRFIEKLFEDDEKFIYMMKTMIDMEDKITLRDQETSFKDDVLECVEFYLNGFNTDDQELSVEISELQNEILTTLHRIHNVENWISVFGSPDDN